MKKIYVYDNATGINIPQRVDVYPVELLLGSTISEIHTNINNDCKLFCVFTPISSADIIVQSKSDLEILSATLKFGKYSFTIEMQESSIWYSNNAEKNIIFSNTVDLPSTEIEAILKLYLNELNLKKKIETKRKRIEMYTVINTRRNNILLKTPNFQEAKYMCDQNPCCIIVNRDYEEIYRSSYRIKPDIKQKYDHIMKHKYTQQRNPDILKFRLR